MFTSLSTTNTLHHCYKYQRIKMLEEKITDFVRIIEKCKYTLWA